MKKRLGMLFGVALICTAVGATAQDYYTLPEVREQAADGWHETYTDKFGRTVDVDIDIEVFGEEKAPVLRGGYGKIVEEGDKDTDPTSILVKTRERRGGVSTYLYRQDRDHRAELERAYGADYGNDMTLGECYAFFRERLEANGISPDEFNYDRPEKFEVPFSLSKDGSEVLLPAFYRIQLYNHKYGLPILNSMRAAHYEPCVPRMMTGAIHTMIDRERYFVSAKVFDVDEVLAQDIPLAPVKRVIESTEEWIESGYLQRVYSMRFGYVVYADPQVDWRKNRSSYDVDTWYLVPTWVIGGLLSDIDPKEDMVARAEGTDNYDTLFVNAQTGQVIDRFDTSYYGYGDPRYKGFISWEEVR